MARAKKRNRSSATRRRERAGAALPPWEDVQALPPAERQASALASVADAAALTAWAQERLAAAVREARSEGCSWEALGGTLGLSRQGVAKRYG